MGMTLGPNGTTFGLTDRAVRLLNTSAISVMLLLFIAMYFGWVPSPLHEQVVGNGRKLDRIEMKLHEHDELWKAIIAQQRLDNEAQTKTLNRLADIIRMIDCGGIPDAALRQRCLNR